MKWLKKIQIKLILRKGEKNKKKYSPEFLEEIKRIMEEITQSFRRGGDFARQVYLIMFGTFFYFPATVYSFSY